MPHNPPNNYVTWDTVQMPLSRGIDQLTTPRAVAPDHLLELLNGWMPHRVGVESRRGHTTTPVRLVSTLTPRVRPAGLPVADQLLSREPTPAALELPSDGSLVFGTSSDEGPDLLAGNARRDLEVVGWSGWSVHGLSGDPTTPIYAPGGLPAVMPAARTRVTGKLPYAQTRGDLAATARIEVVVTVVGAMAYYSVYDAVTGAPFVVSDRLFGAGGGGGGAVVVGPTEVDGVRAVPVGGSVYIGIHYDQTEFVLYRIDDTDPAGAIQRPWSGDAAVDLDWDRSFDMRQITGNVMSLVYSNGGDTLVRFVAFDGIGNQVTSYGFTGVDAPNYDLGDTPHNIVHATHPVTGEICVINGDQAGETVAHVVSVAGGAIAVLEAVPTHRLTVVPRWSLTGGGAVFDVWYDFDDSEVGVVCVPSITFADPNGSVHATIQYALLAGHAFRSGDRSFAPVFHDSVTGATLITYQDSYFLMDVDNKPVARLEYGTADKPPFLQATGEAPGVATAPYLPSGNFAVDQDTLVNPRRFHSLLFSRLRVDSVSKPPGKHAAPNITATNSADQFDEQTPKRVDWQILPRLRAAQAGRTLYFAGGMLHAYDGAEVAEAQHLLFPEMHTVPESSNGAGTMVAGQIFRYRAYAAYKNAQGEEVLSAALTTDEVTVGVGHNTITLKLATNGFTRRTGVYWLIFRNETSGTVWNLISNRDPTLAPRNDPSVAEVTFTDITGSADNVAHELDPANTGILQNFAPPASEVIAAGRDRLWLAGGEIAPGDILPSLLQRTGSVASFSGFLTTTLDRGVEPVTGLAFMNLSTLVFKARKTYALESAGPNNFGAGAFDDPRTVANFGTLSQESIIVAQPGTFFQSEAGFKLLGTGYQVLDVGDSVLDEGASATVTGVVHVPRDQNIRWYRADGPALVLDTSSGDWARWSGLESVGAVNHPVTGLAVLARVNGDLWTETEDLYTDAGRGFSVAFRTAWFGGPGETFQRLRRLAVNGDLLGPHVLHLRLYFDDSEVPVDEWTWNPYDDLNDDTWGSGSWGDGLWGDTGATLTVRSSVYALRRRVRRQKCARFSLEVFTESPGTGGGSVTAITAEVARKPGINRLGARTFGTGV